MSRISPRRRHLLGTALLAALLPFTATHAQGSGTWPTQSVRIIVPFAPGGGADTSARALAEILSPQLGQAVVVENRPGAGSAIGVTAAAQSQDGHTLLMGSNSMVINPSLNPSLKYDVERDFDAIGMVSAQPLVLVVPAESNLRTIDDIIAAGKAQPGSLSAGNSGNGTLAHLSAELFAAQTGIQLTPVSYKGESALLPDLLAARVSLGFLNLPSVAPHIQAGRLRALAISSPEPRPDLPNVPTLRSLNYPMLEVQGWAALLAPKNSLSPAARTRLETLLKEALASERIQSRFATLNVTPVIRGSQETDTFLKVESKRYADIIKARGIKVE